MAARVYAQRFVVEGVGQFPVDMLRYDQAVPWSEVDSGKIATDWGSREALEPRQVAVLRHVSVPKPRPGGLGWPTVERWRSFGWRVLEETVEMLA